MLFRSSLLGAHRHPITDGGHTHGVNDPTHLHGVNDPGHTHTDNGAVHTHPVTDPGHVHGIRMYEIGYAAAATSLNNTTMSPNPTWSPYYDTYTPDFIDDASAGLTINTASANLVTDLANANVSDLVNFTGITVNPAVTNISETDPEGGFRTVPANLALIPYIKY